MAAHRRTTPRRAVRLPFGMAAFLSITALLSRLVFRNFVFVIPSLCTTKKLCCVRAYVHLLLELRLAFLSWHILFLLLFSVFFSPVLLICIFHSTQVNFENFLKVNDLILKSALIYIHTHAYIETNIFVST